MRKGKNTLSPEKYQEIREFAKTHTIQETADKYGISSSTIHWVKRYDSFREMKAKRAENQRDYYRKTNNVSPSAYRVGDIAPEDKKEIDSPFEEDVAPKPVLPVNAEKAPTQDGEPVTTQEATMWEGKIVKEWAEEAKKWEEMAGELNIELDKYKSANKENVAYIKSLENKVERLERSQTITVNELTAVKSDPTCSIFVKVGDIEVSVPIPQK